MPLNSLFSLLGLLGTYRTYSVHARPASEPSDHLKVVSSDHQYGEALPSSCIGKEHGSHWLLLNEFSSPLNLVCDNDFIILDVNKDSSLADHFSSWEMWHTSLAGPSNSDPVNWQDWFLADEQNKEFVISPDCNTCELEHQRQVFSTKTSYWMTGNLAKLHWGIIGFTECDMDFDTYQCFNCETCTSIGLSCDPEPYDETTTDYTNAGICGVTVVSADHEVTTDRESAQLMASNYKPSLGTSGEFCVCYRPQQPTPSYKLSEAQEHIIQDKIQSLESEKLSNNNQKIGSDGSHGSDGSDGADLRSTNTIYLTQEDFAYGTYRILESGTYIIKEDIIFDFNHEDDWWPRADQYDFYRGADSLRDEYHLGFFAGITVESDYVTIDLNGKTLKQSVEFYFQQRWFAIIELGSQQFLPGQGPAFFGNDPKQISNIVIKNGVLGLCSHFGVHGNFPINLEIRDVHVKHFVTHGVQLNGWENVVMENIEVGPSSTMEYLRGDYGHARIIAQRLRKIESEMEEKDILHHEDYQIQFNNHETSWSITDLVEELESQMALAFEYACNRYFGRFSESDFIDPKHLDTQEEILRWKQAKKQFIQESGLPSASSSTGIFLNFFGSSVFSYIMDTNERSEKATLQNIYVHDMKHEMVESMRFSYSGSSGQVHPTPWNSDIPADLAFGSKDTLLTVRNALDNDEDVSKIEYIGSIMTDAYFALGDVVDHAVDNDWGYLGFLEVRNIKSGREDLLAWVKGAAGVQSDWVFGCNQDIMGHSGKGLLGIRMDGVSDVQMDNIRIERLHDLTPLGSDACGEYKEFNILTGGGHFKQFAPMQHGFSGNNVQAVSITSSDAVVIKDVSIEDVVSDNGDAYGISFWTSNDVEFASDSFVKISNIRSGVSLKKGELKWTSLPNREPEACAVRLEDTSDCESNIVFDSDESDVMNVMNDMNVVSGLKNIVVCDVNGLQTCLSDGDKTMYGNYFNSKTVCEMVNGQDSLMRFLEHEHETQQLGGKMSAKNEKVEAMNANANGLQSDMSVKEKGVISVTSMIVSSFLVFLGFGVFYCACRRGVKDVDTDDNGYNNKDIDMHSLKSFYGSI